MTDRRPAGALLAALLAALAWGCGSVQVTGAPGGAGGAGAGGVAGAAGSEPGGWTDCSSPSGYAICGGPAGCVCPHDPPPCLPEDGPNCWCLGEEYAASGGVSACLNDALADVGCCQSGRYLCPDGKVAVQYDGPDSLSVFCVPFDLALLFDHAGAGELVRYVDQGLWTGDPLPLPASCPVLPGVRLCGGHCGGCPPGEVCTGRSRLHPYSFCVPDTAPSCSLPNKLCDGGLGCFVFTVEPEAQPRADAAGYCLEPGLCQAAASELPGGGKCVL